MEPIKFPLQCLHYYTSSFYSEAPEFTGEGLRLQFKAKNGTFSPNDIEISKEIMFYVRIRLQNHNNCKIGVL
jgi:hypothetical protein